MSKRATPIRKLKARKLDSVDYISKERKIKKVMIFVETDSDVHLTICDPSPIIDTYPAFSMSQILESAVPMSSSFVTHDELTTILNIPGPPKKGGKHD